MHVNSMETATLCAEINNIIKNKQFFSPSFDAVCRISASEFSKNSRLYFLISCNAILIYISLIFWTACKIQSK